MIGAILGYVIWPMRVDTYSKVWMPLLGAYIGLWLRFIGLGIWRAVQKRRRAPVRRVASAATMAGSIR